MPDVPDAVYGALAEARALGFLGPGPIEEHITSAAGFLESLLALGASGPGLDLGAGGGIPGLLLATWLPAWRWTFLDGQRRRTSFLARAVAASSLADRVDVVRGRAEDVAHDPAFRGTFGAVTARSFGPPPLTAEAAAPFLRRSGVLVVSEPPDTDPRWDPSGLEELGLEAVVPPITARTMATFRAVGSCPLVFPRPINQQRARPQW